LQYIPANTAYIKVSADAPAELKVYTQAEYDQLTPAVVGDLSGDGEVTVTDQVIIGNIILGLRPYSAEADLNHDGVVNVTDYVALGNIILGKNNE
jgi:ABC-type glucose/galactose transport system permease subunit